MKAESRAIIFGLVAVSIIGGVAAPVSAAPKPKVVINKPSAPTIIGIASSPAKKNKVNLTISISLPSENGGSPITGSKVSAKGASCTMAKTKTTCVIKNVVRGKSFNFVAQSKNKKGGGANSPSVTYLATGESWSPPPVFASPISYIPTPAPAPAPTPAPPPSPRAPTITISSNTCVNPSTIKCNYEFATNEAVNFTWTQFCGHHADGGGDFTEFGFEIYRIGSPATCPMTVTATSSATGLSSTLNLTISIPGTWPGSWSDYCQPWGTCVAPVLTVASDTCVNSTNVRCFISFSANENVEYSWSNYCGHHGEGGGNWDNFGFEVFLIGSSGRCPVTITATNPQTGLTSTLDVSILIPGTFPGVWADYCQTSNSCAAPSISVVENGCANSTKIGCSMSFATNEIVDFSWSTYCGHFADGGGNWDSFGFYIYLIGDAQNCPMTVTATSLATGLTTTMNLVIEIPGLHLGTWSDYCQPSGTCVQPVITVLESCVGATTVDCFMNFRADVPVDYEWTTYCGHTAEGGGNWDNFGFYVYLVGNAASCPMTLKVTSLENESTTYLDFTVEIPGTFPGVWTDYCQTSNSCVAPIITVASETCTDATSAHCFYSFTTNEPVSFTWSQYCGHHADGGGDVQDFGFEIFLIGDAQSCPMTVTATSVATGLSTTLELVVLIPGTYPGTWADYPQYFA